MNFKLRGLGDFLSGHAFLSIGRGAFIGERRKDRKMTDFTGFSQETKERGTGPS